MGGWSVRDVHRVRVRDLENKKKFRKREREGTRILPEGKVEVYPPKESKKYGIYSGTVKTTT